MNVLELRGPRVLLAGGACVLLGGAVMFAATRLKAKDVAAGTPAQETGYVEAIAPVGSVKAKAADGIGKQAVTAVPRPVTVRLTGSLEADEKSDVGSNAAGNVSETFVDRGSIVKKGAVLVQIDPRDAAYALEEGKLAAEQLRERLGLEEGKPFKLEQFPEIEAARLALELAERNYHRQEALRKEKATSIEAADQAETEYRSAVQRHRLTILQAKQAYLAYQQAMARLTILKKALDDCSIRAPFDGCVVDRSISVGERVIAMFPGAKLVTMVRIDPLRLSLTVPQQEMARVKEGQTVTFQADAFPLKKFTGTVRYITPQVTSDNRSMCVEAVVPNPDLTLRPGLFVTAELHLDRQRSDLYVPQAAVRSRGEVAAVFVVRGGVIREQIVSLGDSADGRILVTSGLAPRDVVITTPDKVRDGDPAS
jgi:membrane fusion protein (multidrug efflux system)